MIKKIKLKCPHCRFKYGAMIVKTGQVACRHCGAVVMTKEKREEHERNKEIIDYQWRDY